MRSPFHKYPSPTASLALSDFTCELYLGFWPPVPALDLYTITVRMMKQNLKYYSAPRDSYRDNDMSFGSQVQSSPVLNLMLWTFTLLPAE